MQIIHSWRAQPFFLINFLFMAGITLGWLLGAFLSYHLMLIAAITIFFIMALLQRNAFMLTLLFLLFIFIMGMLRIYVTLFLFSNQAPNLFSGKIASVKGVVVDASQTRGGKGKYILACSQVKTDNKQRYSTDFKLLVLQSKGAPALEYGQEVIIHAQPLRFDLPANPGAFNYRRYQDLNGVAGQIWLKKDVRLEIIGIDKGAYLQRVVFNPVRKDISRRLEKYLSKDHALIAKALILGERGNMDSGMLKQFQKSGVIHVLAISGLHVGFIALFVGFLLNLMRLKQAWVIAGTILFLLFFMALVNFKAPVVRASLMMIFYYIAQIQNRPQQGLQIISLAAFIILLFKPQELLLPGFQYSFCAVFGLVYGLKQWQKWLPQQKEPSQIKNVLIKYLFQPALGSLAAVVATLPLTLYYFGVAQTGALIANIIVIPAIAVVLFLIVILVLFSYLTFLPTTGVAAMLTIILNLLLEFISAFSQLPFIQINFGFPGIIGTLFTVLLVLSFYHISKPFGRMGLVLLTLLFLLNNAFYTPATLPLRVTFIHVGQGDAVLLQLPNGKTALIDAGNKGFGFDAGARYVGPYLKYLAIDKIDWLIASHPHSDHIGGFEHVMEAFEVDTLLINEYKVPSKMYARLLNTAQKKKIAIKQLDRGDKLKLDSNMRCYILHPSDSYERRVSKHGKDINNSSFVFKVVYGAHSFMLSGDAEHEAEEALLGYGSFLESTILKAGHHGSKTSSSAAFIDFVKPKHAVISVGKKNKFKHPSPSTLTKFINRGVPIYRTDRLGAVIFETDGRDLKLVTWR